MGRHATAPSAVIPAKAGMKGVGVWDANPFPVIPAKAGIQSGGRRGTSRVQAWMPACAGMTGLFW